MNRKNRPENLPLRKEYVILDEMPTHERPFVINMMELPRGLGEAHYHNGVEVSWIPKGTARFFFEGRYYNLTHDDVFFLNAALPHHTGKLHEPTFHIGYVHLNTEAVAAIPPFESGLSALQLFFARPAGATPFLRNRPDICAHLYQAYLAYTSQAGDFKRIEAWGHIMLALSAIIESVKPSTSPGSIPPDSVMQVAVHAALEFISANFNKAITVRDIATACNMSESSLSHTFSQLMNCSPIEYRNRIRANFAIEKLLSTRDKLDSIAEDCGFDSVTALYYLVKETTGHAPGYFRKHAGI
jgi:AraC-like DNA-binding protein